VTAMDKNTVRAITREIFILVLIAAVFLVAVIQHQPETVCANAQAEAWQ